MSETANQPGTGSRAKITAPAAEKPADGLQAGTDQQCPPRRHPFSTKNDDSCAHISGDDDDACRVSAMRIGAQMQSSERGANLAKRLLYAIRRADEASGDQIGPAFTPVTGDLLDYDDVMAKFDTMMERPAKTYVSYELDPRHA